MSNVSEKDWDLICDFLNGKEFEVTVNRELIDTSKEGDKFYSCKTGQTEIVIKV